MQNFLLDSTEYRHLLTYKWLEIIIVWIFFRIHQTKIKKIRAAQDQIWFSFVFYSKVLRSKKNCSNKPNVQKLSFSTCVCVLQEPNQWTACQNGVNPYLNSLNIPLLEYHQPAPAINKVAYYVKRRRRIKKKERNAHITANPYHGTLVCSGSWKIFVDEAKTRRARARERKAARKGKEKSSNDI